MPGETNVSILGGREGGGQVHDPIGPGDQEHGGVFGLLCGGHQLWCLIVGFTEACVGAARNVPCLQEGLAGWGAGSCDGGMRPLQKRR